jgi:TIR domain
MAETLQQSGLTVGGERVPEFFFSYARADSTTYLERFFKDLRDKVAGLEGVDADADFAFFDTHSIETGQDFETHIARALQVSKVLVSVYSPRYFSKQKKHEYCAKEFDAFLKRNPNTRYEAVTDEGQKRYIVRDASNILPVLWYSECDLMRADNLPPLQVRKVLYTLNKLTSNVGSVYKDKGLSSIARRRQTTYDEIVLALARVIQDFSRQSLPPMPNPPDFAALRNPFWDTPEGAENIPLPVSASAGAVSDDLPVDALQNSRILSATAPTIQTKLQENCGPRLLFAIEVRVGEGLKSIWASDEKGEQSLASILDEIGAERRLVCVRALLDPSETEFLQQAKNTLSAATALNTTTVLLVDPDCLEQARVQEALINLLEGSWRGGFLLPVTASDYDSLQRVESFCARLKLSDEQQDRIVFRRVVGSAGDFRSAMISIVDDVVGRIIKQAEVQRGSPDNSGPEKKPAISNVA